MIEANDVSLIYPDGTTGLKSFTLRIPKGSLYFITGPSGSGKTSLLHLILGIIKPTAGLFTVLENDMSHITAKELLMLRQKIGPVFQEFRLTPGRTALENVMAGMRFLKNSSPSVKFEALAALDHVGLSNKAFTEIEHLSWGERQRVAIARAVARKPKLVLADEPTGTLDIDNARSILSLLKSLQNEDCTVIITTHATHLINEIESTETIKMEKGVMSFVKQYSKTNQRYTDHHLYDKTNAITQEEVE